MSAGLYGLMAALGWGGADFIARFTGRAVGHQQALLGMLSISAIAMSLIIFLLDIPFVFVMSGWWLLVLTGVGTMVATLLLYWALARGPVTIVAPIVGSFPIFNVILAVCMGSRPEIIQWLAMVAVFLGVWMVACASTHFESHPDYNRQHLRQTIIIALVSSLGFGITVAAAQAASPIYGELQTICIARWISLLCIALVFIYKQQVPIISLACWPLLGLQGFMDTGAYAALALSTQSENAELAVVTASGFSIVTVLLARYFLQERMSRAQWCGVIFIVAGVVVLSYY